VKSIVNDRYPYIGIGSVPFYRDGKPANGAAWHLFYRTKELAYRVKQAGLRRRNGGRLTRLVAP